MKTSSSGLIQDRSTQSNELHSLTQDFTERLEQQQQEQDLALHAYHEYENLNRRNHDNEIALKHRRIKQQTRWENQLKASYQWQDEERRKNQWLQRREYEKEEDVDYGELEDEAWNQLEKLEQREDEQRKRKEQWEQEQLKLYLAVEECEKNYVAQLKQIHSMEEIDEEERLQ